MLLERSLSDRLWPATGSAVARRQAVLGFEISLDPPKEARDAAAEVEVTLSAEDGTAPLDLVALMPLEKTYNSAALASSSNSFGGSAVVKIITIGYSEQRRGETLYLYRDTDTIALQRMSNPAGTPQNAITFGWQFRPVLGRRSVSPGVRQMFAVIALPTQDGPRRTDSFPVKVSMRTYWRYYDHGTLTTSETAGWWSWFRSLPSAVTHDYGTLNINPTASTQASLAPTVDEVQWVSTDDKIAVVLVSVANFFHGTTVALGSTTLTESNGGLILKSDQALQINVPLNAVATGDAVIIGRYGPSKLLKIPSAKLHFSSIFICSLDLNPAGDQFYSLSLHLAPNCLPGHAPLRLEHLPTGNRPVLLINGNAYTQPYQLYEDTTAGEVILQTMIPMPLIQTKNAIATVKFPFMSDGWTPSFGIYDPCSFPISRLGGGKTTSLIINGIQRCGSNWRVLLDQSYDVNDVHGPLRHPAADVLTFEPDSEVLKQYKKLIVYALDDKAQVLATVILDIPPATAPPADPKLDPKVPPQIMQYEGRGVTYTGSGLKAITKVEFNGQTLSFAAKDGNEITVFLTPAATDKPGLDDILLKTADGTIIPAPLLITPAPVQPAEKK
jgi:hypothetical protein